MTTLSSRPRRHSASWINRLAPMPRRQRGVEWLDDPNVDAADREQSHRDLVRSNDLFGGQRAVGLALRSALDELASAARPDGASMRGRVEAQGTLLDVGTGLADIPWRVREMARRRGVRLQTFGLDGTQSLLVAAHRKIDAAVCADALALPFGDKSIDLVLCSQLLHHFEHEDAVRLIAELNRVARVRVVISDLRRSLVAASGFWVASVALRFHPITRHDGPVSVMRGFTEAELGGLVLRATGWQPAIRRRLGFRLTASWTPHTTTPVA